MLRFADLKFRSLTRKDWLEAFLHVPDVEAIVDRQIQRMRTDIPLEEIDRLYSRLDRYLVRYQRKFGHKFILLNEDADLEGILIEIQTRFRHDPPEEMDALARHRRLVSLRNLEQLMASHRPQQGDGVVVSSTVSGESLPREPEQRPKPSQMESASVDRDDVEYAS